MLFRSIIICALLASFSFMMRSLFLSLLLYLTFFITLRCTNLNISHFLLIFLPPSPPFSSYLSALILLPSFLPLLPSSTCFFPPCFPLPQSYFNLTPGSQHVASWAVVEGVTMEFTMARVSNQPSHQIRLSVMHISPHVYQSVSLFLSVSTYLASYQPCTSVSLYVFLFVCLSIYLLE